MTPNPMPYKMADWPKRVGFTYDAARQEWRCGDLRLKMFDHNVEPSFATTEEAANHLRVSPTTFLRWAGRKKPAPAAGTPLATIALWLRPSTHSGELLWCWQDVYAIEQIILGMRLVGGVQPADDDEKT